MENAEIIKYHPKKNLEEFSKSRSWLSAVDSWSEALHEHASGLSWTACASDNPTYAILGLGKLFWLVR